MQRVRLLAERALLAGAGARCSAQSTVAQRCTSRAASGAAADAGIAVSSVAERIAPGAAAAALPGTITAPAGVTGLRNLLQVGGQVPASVSVCRVQACLDRASCSSAMHGIVQTKPSCVCTPRCMWRTLAGWLSAT